MQLSLEILHEYMLCEAQCTMYMITVLNQVCSAPEDHLTH
jgi:hypothetical protein